MRDGDNVEKEIINCSFNSKVYFVSQKDEISEECTDKNDLYQNKSIVSTIYNTMDKIIKTREMESNYHIFVDNCFSSLTADSDNESTVNFPSCSGATPYIDYMGSMNGLDYYLLKLNIGLNLSNSPKDIERQVTQALGEFFFSHEDCCHSSCRINSFLEGTKMNNLVHYASFQTTIQLVFDRVNTLFDHLLSTSLVYIDNAPKKFVTKLNGKSYSSQSYSGYTPTCVPVHNNRLRMIKLGVTDGENNKDIVYQFVHELMHHVVYSHFESREKFDQLRPCDLHYSEEELCTAMAISMVKELFYHKEEDQRGFFSEFFEPNKEKVEEEYKRDSYYYTGFDLSQNVGFDCNELKVLLLDLIESYKISVKL